jgi:hypothetical protein
MCILINNWKTVVLFEELTTFDAGQNYENNNNKVIFIKSGYYTCIQCQQYSQSVWLQVKDNLAWST